jgi:hypothetical protein
VWEEEDGVRGLTDGGDHRGGSAGGLRERGKSELNVLLSLLLNENQRERKREREKKRTSELMDSSARVFLPERSVTETKMGAMVVVDERFCLRVCDQ